MGRFGGELNQEPPLRALTQLTQRSKQLVKFNADKKRFFFLKDLPKKKPGKAVDVRHIICSNKQLSVCSGYTL